MPYHIISYHIIIHHIKSYQINPSHIISFLWCDRLLSSLLTVCSTDLRFNSTEMEPLQEVRTYVCRNNDLEIRASLSVTITLLTSILHCLSVCLSLSLSSTLPLTLFLSLSSLTLSISLSVSHSLYLPICLSLNLSLYLTLCLHYLFSSDYTFISDIADGVIRSIDRPLGYQVR